MFFFNCIVLQQNTVIKYLFYSINMLNFTQKIINISHIKNIKINQKKSKGNQACHVVCDTNRKIKERRKNV